MPTIQIRIDDKTKKSAQKVLNELGLDMSSAIKVYLKQIALHKAIPLRLTTPNGLTPDEEIAVTRAAAEAINDKNVTQSMSVKQAIQYLEKL